MSQRADLVIGLHSSGLPAVIDAQNVAMGEPSVSVTAASPRPLELAVAAVVVLLPLASVPGLWSPTFTPKLAVLGVLLALGLPRLAMLARRGPLSSTARAMLAFLAVALVSALVSQSPLVGVFGLYDWGTGFLFWCATAGAFALGATISPAGRRWLGHAIIAAASVNALIAIAQVVGHPAAGWIALYQGTQADGVLANPVYLEALVVAALALVAWRCCEEDIRWGALVPPLAAGLQLSHERLGLALLGLLCVAVIVRFRTARALSVVAAAALGYGLTSVSAGVLTRGPLSGAIVVGNTPRFVAWKLLVKSVPHHLVIGVGPGQTRNAFFAGETLSTLRKLGNAGYFADAHDLVLEIAVTMGALGLVAGAAVAWTLLRKGPRGPFLWFALLLIAVELVEPLEIVVVPLAALGLGASLPAVVPPSGREIAPSHVRARFDRFRRGATTVAPAGLLVAALAAAAVLILGDADLGVGLRGLQLGPVTSSSRLLPMWADTSSAVATVDEVRAEQGDMKTWTGRAIAADLASARRDPGDPVVWAALGAQELVIGDPRAALSAYGEAHRLWPWWTPALMGLGTATRASIGCLAAEKWFLSAIRSSPTDGAARSAARRCGASATGSGHSLANSRG
jgi:hypothetical protein